MGVCGGRVRAVTAGEQQAAVQVLGPHSQLEEGIQEVLIATQTSWSPVPRSTKAAAPRDGHAVTWLLGQPPGQASTALQTARAVTGGTQGKFSQYLSVSSGHE